MVEARKTFPCQAPTVPKIAFEIARDRELWKRQIGETSKQYRGFLVYRDLGLGARSIPATARALGLSQRSGQVSAWSSRNHWRERVNAWDAELECRKQVALTKEIRDMAERHVAAAQNYITALMAPADEMVRRLEDPEFRDLEDLPTPNLLMLVARCASAIPNLMKAERLARGEPTVRVQPPICATGNLFQRIDLYAAAFERVLAHDAESEGDRHTSLPSPK